MFGPNPNFRTTYGYEAPISSATSRPTATERGVNSRMCAGLAGALSSWTGGVTRVPQTTGRCGRSANDRTAKSGKADDIAPASLSGEQRLERAAQLVERDDAGDAGERRLHVRRQPAPDFE